jgi:hypothetical protein
MLEPLMISSTGVLVLGTCPKRPYPFRCDLTLDRYAREAPVQHSSLRRRHNVNKQASNDEDVSLVGRDRCILFHVTIMCLLKTCRSDLRLS